MKKLLHVTLAVLLVSFGLTAIHAEVPQKYPSFSLGLGYGNSYGGIGVCGQVDLTEMFALHAGAGYFPAIEEPAEGTLLFSGGITFYPKLDADPFKPYIDLQFGGIGIEAREWIYWWGVESEQKTLWGISILGGAEIWLSDDFALDAALGLSLNLTEVEWVEEEVNVLVALDAGIIVRF
jgi:hypothetical protein